METRAAEITALRDAGVTPAVGYPAALDYLLTATRAEFHGCDGSLTRCVPVGCSGSRTWASGAETR
ncbi:hypothetical protein AWC26_19065 [Mycobacterium shimoidei]|nr:hypothetical protein BHQ16_07790 [Mycobacterium shimoidei]ORW77552.1 hypothetical protein AWC26_19065 [Mycobacterium shimoidei]